MHLLAAAGGGQGGAASGPPPPHSCFLASTARAAAPVGVAHELPQLRLLLVYVPPALALDLRGEGQARRERRAPRSGRPSAQLPWPRQLWHAGRDTPPTSRISATVLVSNRASAFRIASEAAPGFLAPENVAAMAPTVLREHRCAGRRGESRARPGGNGYYCAQNSCLHHLQRGSAPGRAASGMIDWSLQQRGAGERCCLRRRVRGTPGALWVRWRVAPRGAGSERKALLCSESRTRQSFACTSTALARARSSTERRILSPRASARHLPGVRRAARCLPPAAGLVMPGYKRQPESS